MEPVAQRQSATRWLLRSGKMSYGGRSSIGRASPCGGEGCGIVPRRPPKKKTRIFYPGLLILKSIVVFKKDGISRELEVRYELNNVQNVVLSKMRLSTLGVYEGKKPQAVIPVAPENGCNITKEIKKREEARQFVDTYMSTHPCVDCNETDPDSLTFNHVRDVKKTTIANMVNLGYSIRRCNPK